MAAEAADMTKFADRLERKWVPIDSADVDGGTDDSAVPSFTVLQWNQLADGLAQSGDFVKCAPELLPWEVRRGPVIAEMLAADADIICMEEVNHFDDLLAGIASAGYEGFFVQKGSRELNFGGKPADGTAIFVRSSRFSIAARSVVQYVGEDGAPAKRHSQKGVTAVLSDKAAGGRTVIVGATHFKAKADPKAAAKRLRQVTQLLEACEALQRTHSAPAAAADGGGADAGTSGAAGAGADGEGKVPVPVIVVGDWNTDPDTPTYAHAAGHALGLRSVYGPGGADTEPAYTTWKFRSAKKAGDPPHEAKHTIDYIWHTPAALRATARWSIPTEAELRPNGLPCPWYPSDHLAIGAKFRYV